MKSRRVRTPENLEALKRDLVSHTWADVYVSDANAAFNAFLTIFSELYDKNCPCVSYSEKQKYEEKPWITKGLQNACKKKNLLYREFLKQRTVNAERKYKIYKNKLTKIWRH